MGYCQTEKQNSKYLKSVGDIAFDSLMDQKEFFLCNEKDIMQYHNNSRGLEYRGEKLAIIEAFEKNMFRYLIAVRMDWSEWDSWSTVKDKPIDLEL